MPQEKPENSSAVYVKDVPSDTVRAFKAICAEKGITMRQGLILAFRKLIKDHQLKKEKA